MRCECSGCYPLTQPKETKVERVIEGWLLGMHSMAAVVAAGIGAYFIWMYFELWGVVDLASVFFWMPLVVAVGGVILVLACMIDCGLMRINSWTMILQLVMLCLFSGAGTMALIYFLAQVEIVHEPPQTLIDATHRQFYDFELGLYMHCCYNVTERSEFTSPPLNFSDPQAFALPCSQNQTSYYYEVVETGNWNGTCYWNNVTLSTGLDASFLCERVGDLCPQQDLPPSVDTLNDFIQGVYDNFFCKYWIWLPIFLFLASALEFLSLFGICALEMKCSDPVREPTVEDNFVSPEYSDDEDDDIEEGNEDGAKAGGGVSMKTGAHKLGLA